MTYPARMTPPLGAASCRAEHRRPALGLSKPLLGKNTRPSPGALAGSAGVPLWRRKSLPPCSCPNGWKQTACPKLKESYAHGFRRRPVTVGNISDETKLSELNWTSWVAQTLQEVREAEGQTVAGRAESACRLRRIRTHPSTSSPSIGPNNAIDRRETPESSRTRCVRHAALSRACKLFGGDRAPDPVYDARRIARDGALRELEVLGPQTQTRRTRQLGVTREQASRCR